MPTISYINFVVAIVVDVGRIFFPRPPPFTRGHHPQGDGLYADDGTNVQERKRDTVPWFYECVIQRWLLKSSRTSPTNSPVIRSPSHVLR